MTRDDLPPLREVIRELALSARKSLGQNFILDLNLTGRIARAAGDLADKTVVEIGPGPGGLTRALLSEGAAHVIAIERDRRVEPALQAIAAHYPQQLSVHFADAVDVDYRNLVDGPAQIVANLPYGAATALLVHWLTEDPWPPWYEQMTLMFQKEVAARIVAEPGNKSYGRLAVLAQWRSTPRILFTLPPQAFTPPPKVDSALVQLVPKPNPEPSCLAQTLGRLTGAAFGQRRKMLRSSLRQISPDPEGLLAVANIDPTCRAEQLSVAQFCQLARHMDENGES